MGRDCSHTFVVSVCLSRPFLSSQPLTADSQRAISNLSHTLFAVVNSQNPLAAQKWTSYTLLVNRATVTVNGSVGSQQVICWSLFTPQTDDRPYSPRLTERKGNLSTLSIPKAFSCRMTGARLLRCISGTVDLGSFSKSSSVVGENKASWLWVSALALCSQHDRIRLILSSN